MPAIVFDLGGTYLRCALALMPPIHPRFSFAHKTHHRIPNFLAASSGTRIWDGVLRLVTDYVSSVAIRAGPAAPVIIGFPGPVDSEGRIIAAPTIAGKQGSIPDLLAAVNSATGRPTFLLNDMSAAAWGFSAKTDAHRFIIVTVSSGIGSKIFDRTLGVIDHPSYAGEIGHVMVDSSPTAPICDCGGRGHLGAIASGRGIERAARQKASRDPIRFQSSLCASRFGATAEDLNNEAHLVPAACAGDMWTRELILDCTKPLGQMLHALAIGIGLDRIAVMGGFAQSLGPLYLRFLGQAMGKEHAFPGFPVVNSRLLELCDPDNDLGLLGAAMYAHQLRELISKRAAV